MKLVSSKAERKTDNFVTKGRYLHELPILELTIMLLEFMYSEIGNAIFPFGGQKSFSRLYVEEVIFDGTSFDELDKKYQTFTDALSEYGWKRRSDLDSCGFEYYSYAFERTPK